MDWLERHLREFVLPVIKSGFKSGSITPFTGKLNPASGCQWPETGMLKTALKSWNLWMGTPEISPKEYVSNITAKQFERFSWAGMGGHSITIKESQASFNPVQILHTTIKNSVKDLRQNLAKGTKILLLGRDVWPWAILCEKYGVPYVFDPRVSRSVAGDHEKFAAILAEIGAKQGDTLFDTGFNGTIHYHAEKASELQLVNLMLSSGKNEYQQFRNNGLIRNRALVAEYLPKYFKSGHVRHKQKKTPDGFDTSFSVYGDMSPIIITDFKYSEREVVQDYTLLNEFVQCALTTIWFWNFESPAWIPGPAYINSKGPAKSSNFSYI